MWTCCSGPRLFCRLGESRFGLISFRHSEFIIHLSAFTLHNSLRPCEYSLPTAITEVQTMANPKHLKILKQGVDAWNKWRVENPGITPVLEGADLREADLPARGPSPSVSKAGEPVRREPSRGAGRARRSSREPTSTGQSSRGRTSGGRTSMRRTWTGRPLRHRRDKRPARGHDVRK